MQYFDTLPKLIYTNGDRISTIMTNIMARASIIPKILKNPLVYYSYDIQEGDTPEIIANKYYDNSYRYWIVLIANEMLDPQWSWPLSYANFERYIKDKYGFNETLQTWSVLNPYSTTYEWQKIITQYDASSQTTTVNTIVIDENTYNNLVETTNTYTVATGQVTISITKKTISYYDWELEKNESKRNIKLLNQVFVDQLENEFKKLMS